MTTPFKQYTIVKITENGVVNLDLMDQREYMTLKWVKVRNKGLYNVNDCAVVVNYNSGGNQTVTVPNGSYTVTSFMTELEVQLDTIDVGFGVTFDEDTQRMVISHSTNTFTMTSLSDCFSRVTGFSGVYAASTSYTASSPVNLSNGAIAIFGLGETSFSSNVPNFSGASIVLPNISSSNSEQVYEQLNIHIKLSNYSSKRYNLTLKSEYSDILSLDKVEILMCFEY